MATALRGNWVTGPGSAPIQSAVSDDLVSFFGATEKMYEVS